MASSELAPDTVEPVRLRIVPNRKDTITKEKEHPDAVPDGASEFATALHQLDVEHRKLRTAFADRLGLTHNEYDAFIHIAEARSSTPKELSATLRFTTGATTAMIDRLENMDLVRRIPNPTDRRSVLIEPTAHGTQQAGWVIDSYIRAAGDAVTTHDTLTAQQLTETVDHITAVIADAAAETAKAADTAEH